MHIKYLFSVTSANNCVWVLQETEKEDRCTIQLSPIKADVHGKSGNAPQMQKKEKLQSPYLGPSLAPTKLYQEPKGSDSYDSLFQVPVKLCRTVFHSLWHGQTDKHQACYLLHELPNRFECAFPSACLPLSLKHGAVAKLSTFKMTVDSEEGQNLSQMITFILQK